MIETLGIKNAEKLIPIDDDQKPADPVTENMAMLNGKPVKAFIHQDHEAHIAAHMAFGQDPKIQQMLKMQGPGADAKMAAGMAHLNEHLAFMYRRGIEEQLGVPLPPPGTQLPDDAEVALSRVVAQAADKLTGKNMQEMQAQQAEQAAKDPVVQMQQHEMQLQEGELQRKTQKDQMDHKIDMVKMKIEAAKVDNAQISKQVDQAFQAKKSMNDTKLAESRERNLATKFTVDAAYKAKKSMNDAGLERERIASQSKGKEGSNK